MKSSFSIISCLIRIPHKSRFFLQLGFEFPGVADKLSPGNVHPSGVLPNALITPARVPDMGRNRNRTFESFVVYPGIVHFLVSGRDDDPPGRDHDRPDAVEQSSGLHEQ